MICKNCSYDNPADATVCGNCGAAISTSLVAAEAPAQPLATLDNTVPATPVKKEKKRKTSLIMPLVLTIAGALGQAWAWIQDPFNGLADGDASAVGDAFGGIVVEETAGVSDFALTVGFIGLTGLIALIGIIMVIGRLINRARKGK